MVAREPESENCILPRISTCRAVQVAIVPLSEETMASSSRSLFSVWVTT